MRVDKLIKIRGLVKKEIEFIEAIKIGKTDLATIQTSLQQLKVAYKAISDTLQIKPRKSRPVNQYDMNGNFIKMYSSAAEAAYENNIAPSGITNCATGRTGSAGNFRWKYEKL
jgi:hypothetical protein